MYILTDGPFVHLLSEHTTIVHPWAGNPKIWLLFICISISIQKGCTSIQKCFMHSIACKYFPSLLLHSYKSCLVLVWTISNMQIFFFEYWRKGVLTWPSHEGSKKKIWMVGMFRLMCHSFNLFLCYLHFIC